MAENENDWDLWAVVRSCGKRNNSVHDDMNVNNTSVLEDPTHVTDRVGDFTGSEHRHYFGLDEIISLSNNLNTTNSKIENQTETIPNTPLVVVEHEEKKKKKVRFSMQISSTEAGNTFSYRGKSTERYEILAEKLSEADQWRWRKYGMKRTGDSTFLKSYYRCNEANDCPARRHIQKSSTDPNKVIVTYRGQHNHPHIAMVHGSPNAAAPLEEPSFPSST
ncbi:WRKY transcription factor 22-like [Solanum lycopersicum]|uniref:WRKY transcription factor 22-like n=1 Tax=Solanum lycopersicum TaxID=4081 RepID=UPI003749913A